MTELDQKYLNKSLSDTDISLDSDVSEVSLLEDSTSKLEAFRDMDISIDERVDDFELEEAFADVESPDKNDPHVRRKLM